MFLFRQHNHALILRIVVGLCMTIATFVGGWQWIFLFFIIGIILFGIYGEGLIICSLIDSLYLPSNTSIPILSIFALLLLTVATLISHSYRPKSTKYML